MDITEVRIKLMQEAGDRLAAFCSITFDDCFVVRDLKIIEGASGPFVAMPSRKLTARCPNCGCKNHLRASYCNQCGLRMKEDRVVRDDTGRAKLYADIAHPINARCREMIQDRIVQAYLEEIERAKLPGYVSNYDDYDLEDDYAEPHDGLTASGSSREPRPHTRVQAAERQPAGPHRPQRPVAPSPGEASREAAQSPAERRQTHPPQTPVSGPHAARQPEPRSAEQPTEQANLPPSAPSLPPAAIPPTSIAADESTPSDGFGAGIL